MEDSDTIHSAVKEGVQKKYVVRIWKIFKAEVRDKNTVSAVCAFAMPVLQTELRTLDRKTRNILVKARFNHVKSDIHRLYISWKEGGRGMIGVFDYFNRECSTLV